LDWCGNQVIEPRSPISLASGEALKNFARSRDWVNGGARSEIPKVGLSLRQLKGFIHETVFSVGGQRIANQAPQNGHWTVRSEKSWKSRRCLISNDDSTRKLIGDSWSARRLETSDASTL
jgi:hypothetical protein